MTKPWGGTYSTSWGIRATCEKVGIEPAKQTFAEPFIHDSEHITHRIARKSDSTCIYIITKIPPMPE